MGNSSGKGKLRTGAGVGGDTRNHPVLAVMALFVFKKKIVF